MSKKAKRGEIYWFDFGVNTGSVQNGYRPALVIQASNFNENSPTTIIAAITTADKGQYLPSHIFLGENYGLDRPSTVMLEQIRTVNQEELGTYIGVIEDEQMLKTIAKGIKKTLGMWHYQSSRDEIRCLCKSCLMEYMDTNQYIINRLDPFQREKEPCDRCNRPGYDYTLKQRRKKE